MISAPAWMQRIPSNVLFFKGSGGCRKLERWLRSNDLPRPSLLDLSLARAERRAR